MWSELAILLSIGFSAGILGSLLGLGGGFLLVPLLVLLAGFKMHQAVALSLTAILFTSATSVPAYYVQGRVKPKEGVFLLSFAIPGALLGSYTAIHMPQLLLKLAFSALLIFLSYKMMKGSGKKRKTEKVAFPGAFFAGFLSGSLGIGGGILNVPLLTLALGLEMHEAVGTSMMMVGITAFFGAIFYWIHGLAPPQYFVPLGVGAALGAWVGPKISSRAKAEHLRYLFSAILAAFALALLLRTLLRSSPDHHKVHSMGRNVHHLQFYPQSMGGDPWKLY